MDKSTMGFLAALALGISALIAWGIAYNKKEKEDYPDENSN